MSNPRHVVFDLGGVLLDWNPRHLYRRLLRKEKAIEAFLSDVCDNDWNLAQDAGRSWSEAIAERVALFPKQRALIEAYDRHWAMMVRAPLWDTVALLRRLAANNVRLFAITNFSAEKYRLALHLFPFLLEFEDTVVSAHERLLKPDPRIYQCLLARNGLTAADCLFVDDVEKNAEGARRVGMAAHHFTSAAALESELVARRLLA